ncbi:MAG: virulence RhuM family protein [Bacillota bacterium]
MNSEMIIYTSIDGSTKIDVQVEDETVWLSQMQMTELFQTSKQNISLHINNTFKEGELDEIAVVKESLTTASDGKSYRVKLYNLDVIISVGYRVKSLRGTEFRKWAMNILREYLIKGFTINDEKLKQAGGGSYWKELLERIRDIRSSEKVLYRQVLDLYATSVDYSPKAEETVEFFKVVQNKLHYATHKSTASEVIYQRANSELPFMGLTTFKGDRPIKSETRIAKNYLKEDELAVLNRLVTAFFDLAELRAMRREPMYMKDWVVEIDDFAQRYGQGVLIGGGRISNKQAIIKADQEYEKYKKLEDELLSPVEKEYIDALKKTQKQIETSKK